MRKFKGCISTDKVGSDCEFEFEMDDDATDDEIEAECREMALDHVEWWYEEVSEDKE